MEFIEVPLSKRHCGSFKPPNSSLATKIQFVPSGEQLKLLLHSTGEYLKILVESDGWIHYMVDDALGELYISPSDQIDTSNRIRYGWSIEQNETIAVYCYKRKCAIAVDANTSADLNYPYLQGIPGLNPRYILTMPLMNFQRRCFGVVEFYRDSGEPFCDADMNSCRFLLQQCAEAFKQNENAVFFTTFNDIQSQLQELLEKHTMIDGPDSSSIFLYHIVSMARDCTQALNTSFFFRKNDETLRIVNTDRGYSFLTEETKTRKLGQITRSEISANFHINLMNRQIHGIISACNKTSQMRFCLLDEQILEAFSKISTVWSIIEYISGYVKKQRTLNENILNLIKIQMTNASDFNKKLQTPISADMSIFNSWNYDLGAAPSNRQLVSHAVKMICWIKGKLKIQEQCLCDFVVMIEQCHASTQDFYHTVLSTQALYRLLEGCRKFEKDLEAFAMIIGCFCYNIAVNATPTPTSSIFLRYNLFAKELIRFEIVQFVIQETKLLKDLNKDQEENLLRLIKENMIDMNLRRMKLNTARVGQIVRKHDIRKLEANNDTGLWTLIQSLLPGIGYILGHFRSQEFRELFPNFGLFEYLETNKLSCVDIIQAISLM